jgi:hypothetical protein
MSLRWTICGFFPPRFKLPLDSGGRVRWNRFLGGQRPLAEFAATEHCAESIWDSIVQHVLQ